MITIIINACARSKSHQEKFSKHLTKQLNQHYHLLISAFLLVLLALPRLIIYLYGGCMKSPSEPWLALLGYFISFMPPLLIFPIFVLSSRMYKNIWKKTLKNFWTITGIH